MTNEEDDGGSSGPRLPEDLSDGPLGLSNVLVNQLEDPKDTKSAKKKTAQPEEQTQATSGPLTARKLMPDSVASALAVSVLEQPGGP